MLWLPNKGRVRTITNGGIVGATPGTALPSNATTLLDGAITEVISAANNDQDSWGIRVQLFGTGAATTANRACADILIGGATDDMLIAALICGYATTNFGGGHDYLFPLHIPQGKRIAATLASVRTGINARILITLYGGRDPPWQVGRKVVSYGAQVDNASGQAVTPAASGGAATATQLAASTSEDHFAFLPGFQPGASLTAVTAGYANIGIGVGAATEDRIGTWWYQKDTNENLNGPMGWPAFEDVPAGSRLTMLASISTALETGHGYNGMIYAVS